MSSTFLSNELGQVFTLKELSDKSVSNPKIRKAELMVRIRGFEETSQALGHEALFVTLSCPSKYHRSFSKTGHENPNWGGFTPLDAQAYLNNVWQRIRASLDRSQIRFYGFRVAEPHHDGTPHWHILLFVNVNEAKPLTEIIQHYALLEDPDERGAKQHRCSFTKIDPKKGSATGYIAKYISKNIDGADIEHDSYGENAATSAERVNAWASCWGIRQFQQLGGPSVSVWREARRLKDFQTKDNKSLNELREAADRSDWQKYVQLMGGVFVKRNEQLARPLYEFEMDVSTGELKQSHYDEEPLKTIKGILSSGLKFITRHLKWTKLAYRQAPCFNLEFCQ
ncbi:replication endonuclease [Thiomicrospira sp.]|uniref:replication endonuclease n=1 Tax=Thiomicrospira sp. TaxID=935 RepID=UPI002F957321